MTKKRCNTLWCIEYSSRRGKYHDEAIQRLKGKHINVLQQKFQIKGMSWQWGQQRLQNVGNCLQDDMTSQLKDHNWNMYSMPVLPVSATPKPKLAAHITEGLMSLQMTNLVLIHKSQSAMHHAQGFEALSGNECHQKSLWVTRQHQTVFMPSTHMGNCKCDFLILVLCGNEIPVSSTKR